MVHQCGDEQEAEKPKRIPRCLGFCTLGMFSLSWEAVVSRKDDPTVEAKWKERNKNSDLFLVMLIAEINWMLTMCQLLS